MATGRDADESLAEQLSAVLPKNSQFNFYHVSSPPTRCAPLYSPPPGAKPDRTYCESHFLNVSTTPSILPHEVFVLAIEILIYTTQELTTLFVSKADSTGYLSLLGLPRGQTSPLRSIATTFITYLVRRRLRRNKRLVLSLFARAQGQYLYPGSVENKAKHVSTDRELVRWWCRVIDPILQEYAAKPSVEGLTDMADGTTDEEAETTAQGYLLVPGEDSHIAFLPAHVRADPKQRTRWKHGHPLREIAMFPNAPPRCLVPHFPDDPKARYLDDLDADLPDAANNQLQESPSKRGTGMWKSVRSLEQFWEMMAFRQECSSGGLVGFLWVVFTPPNVNETEGDPLDSQTFGHSSASGSLSQMSVPKLKPPRTSKKKPPRRLTGPIKPRLPRIKKESSEASATLQPEESPFYHWPMSSRGSIVLSDKDYKRVTELLLRLDFATVNNAQQGTAKWIEETAILGSRDKGWAFGVIGKADVGPASLMTEPNVPVVLKVKRKGDGNAQSPTDEPNILASGFVRKKAKVEHSKTRESEATTRNESLVDKKVKAQDDAPDQPSSTGDLETPGINMLAAGLVRKKPRAAQVPNLF